MIPANDKYFARIATLKAINKGLARRLRRPEIAYRRLVFRGR